MEVFKDYAYYYNLFYGDKDYKKEAEQIKKLIEKYSTKKTTSILNLGCGTGRHDYELNKMGYSITGIDLSNDMIYIAKQGLAQNMQFEVGDIRSYIPQKKYDTVISMFHVMSYQTSNNDILSAMATANKALSTGGIFIFDTWYGPGVLSDKPTVRLKKVEDENHFFIRNANPVMYPEDNLVDVYYQILIIDKETSITKKIEEIHRMRYFFKPEIEFLLKQAGFSLRVCIDCNTMKKTDFNSWTAYFVAVKE